jgi:hypothetical protein
MMIKRNHACAITVVVLLSGSAFALDYTGDVAVDFGPYTYIEVYDGANPDVGMPDEAEGAISGWDVERALLWIDPVARRLHVGIEFYGIAGDADGDGADGVTAPWLAGLGGIDYPMLAMTESICVGFDFDMDGQFGVIAGCCATDGCYRVATFAGSEDLMPFGFLDDLPGHTGANFYAPAALTPDYELTIDNIDGLMEIVDGRTTFRFNIFSGSYQDDGVGEDCLCGIVTLDANVSAQPAPASVNLVRAWPNPFNPTTTLEVQLDRAGPVTLAVYNLMGQKVRTIVDGLLPAGQSQFQFEANGLPSGLYLARFETERGASMERLLLTR